MKQRVIFMEELIKNRLSWTLRNKVVFVKELIKNRVILQVKFWLCQNNLRIVAISEPVSFIIYENHGYQKCKNGPDYLQGLFQLPEPVITNHNYCKWHSLNVSEPVYYNSHGAFTLDV
jgi:hypothetical protein